MIAKFMFSDPLTPEEVERLRPMVEEVPEGDCRFRHITGDLEQVIPAFRNKLITILGEATGSVWFDVKQALKRIEAKQNAPAPQFNDRCSVVVPGLGLLLIDEVQVFTDYCTEGLQLELDRGWRILAICPQPDQRRPDYVLGRKRQETSR